MFSIWKLLWAFLKARIKIMACAIYTTLLFYWKKFFVIAVFLSKLEHRSMVYWIYYETLLVWGLVSTWLANATLPVKLKSAKFWSLLFYSELNELCGNYVWISKSVNLHCNWINLISVLNFPKQWVANYRCVFRTLPII